MLTRRGFIKGTAGLAAALTVPNCASTNRPLTSDAWKPLSENPLPFAGLATSLPEEHDYQARVEGQVPQDLRGVLYRNGPGLFERGVYRKRMLLDGDGMVQAFHFYRGRVRYQNRFVRTQKYVDEEKAGLFLYRTWSTPAPGGIFANLGAPILNQAGVTVVRRDSRLYAFDEGFFPYEMDPETLETRGLNDLGVKDFSPNLKAHWKIDATSGDWLHYGLNYGRQTLLKVVVFKKDGSLRSSWDVAIPRRIYMHDWVVSERHVIFVLHPGVIPMGQVIQMALGLISPTEAILWKPELGNLILVMDREGKGAPIFLEAEAAWMWHGLNAYEAGREIVVDFAGDAEAMGLGSQDGPFYTIMEGGDPGSRPLAQGPRARRYLIDPGSKQLKEDRRISEAVVEFPFVNPFLSCTRHRYGYFIHLRDGDWFPTGVIRIDLTEKSAEGFDFGVNQFCSEPVFAPKPGFRYEPGSSREPGWILTLVYNGNTKRSYLAVLEAENLNAGPVALVHLNHHAPFSFHGYWHPAP